MGTRTNRLRGALMASVAATLTMAAVGTAAAQENKAGGVVENTFTLDYEVGGTAQAQVTNAADPTTFTVDRKVDLDVSTGSTPNVVPGQQDVATFFSVENQGNDNFRYRLTASNRATGTGGAEDDFDLGGFALAVVSVANAGACGAGTDFSAAATVAQGTVIGTDVAPGEFLCVRVLTDVPADVGGVPVGDGDDAGVYLTATAVQPAAWINQVTAPATTGLAVVGTALAAAGNNDVDGVAQNVFLDADGVTDAVGDAAHSGEATLTVSTAALAAAKAVFAVATNAADVACATVPAPATQANDQYAVPGACVVYTITVQNTGGQAAQALDIADLMPAGVTFAGLSASGFTGGTLAPAANATSCTEDGDGRCPVSLTGATLAAGSVGSPTVGVLTIRAIVD